MSDDSDEHAYVRRPFPVGAEPDEEAPGEKLRYLLLPPDLSDGASQEVLCAEETRPDVFRELFIMWQDEATEGETLEIGFVEMTEAEFKALPEM